MTTELGPLVGDGKAMQKLRQALRRLAPLEQPVLVTGETGSGKELVARRLHALSRRRAASFVAVNCGALPETLLTSELFGSEEGAFTGARRREGWVRRADGGTLFLDELGELPLPAQSALLRVLETREVTPVGGTRAFPVDFRLICATHRRLRRMVDEGRFRLDLYHRVGALRVRVPPLRRRLEDLPVLGEALLGPDAARVSRSALERLRDHDWPGNVRELRNVLVRALAEADGGPLEGAHVCAALSGDSVDGSLDGSLSAAPGWAGEPLRVLQARWVRAAYRHCEGNIRATARLLEVSPTTVYRHLAMAEE